MFIGVIIKCTIALLSVFIVHSKLYIITLHLSQLFFVILIPNLDSFVYWYITGYNW